MNFVAKIFGYMFIMLGSVIFTSCNETLPVREDLSNLVTIKVHSAYQTNPGSSKVGALRTFITVTNQTDETLDDIATMSGKIEITWEPPIEEQRIFDRTRTFTLSPNDIFYAKSYNRATRRLTLGPGDSVMVYVDWNLKTNDSTFLLYYFNSLNDNQCLVYNNNGGILPRRITVPQNFLVKANIKLFDRIATLYVQRVSIRQCFMLTHYGEANTYINLPPCTDFTKFDPCSAIGQ